ALLMSNLQAAVRGLASPALSPEGLCSRLNSLVCHNTGNDRFITFFYAQLDGPARVLRYTNAGHNAPILLRRDGSHERLQAGGGVLGVFPNQAFAVGAAQLAPGDRVLFFTDGVTEVSDEGGGEFGEERLLRLLQEQREASASALQEKILAAAGAFGLGHWQDDATLLVLSVAE
ncbi:MAG: PP2C family protein-serine/threonine phosphatase, partial [Candidatus Acidiferrum sp.]